MQIIRRNRTWIFVIETIASTCQRNPYTICLCVAYGASVISKIMSTMPIEFSNQPDLARKKQFLRELIISQRIPLLRWKFKRARNASLLSHVRSLYNEQQKKKKEKERTILEKYLPTDEKSRALGFASQDPASSLRWLKTTPCRRSGEQYGSKITGQAAR